MIIMENRVDLTDMDYYELVAELGNYLNVEISENFTRHSDLQVSHWNTADGYDVVVMMNGEYMSDMNWESDVWYYKPDAQDIIDRIIETGEGSEIYIEDFEEFLDDFTIIEFLQESNPEKYDPDYDN